MRRQTNNTPNERTREFFRRVDKMEVSNYSNIYIYIFIYIRVMTIRILNSMEKKDIETIKKG